MPLRCGLIGRPRSGKTTVFNAVTSAHASLFDAADAHRASVVVPDPRVRQLVQMYSPAKVSPAAMDLVDIPGLEEGAGNEEGRGRRLLSHIKESDVLLHVVRCFAQDAEAAAPVDDVERVDLELMAADASTLERKLERLSKWLRAGEKAACREADVCRRVLAHLDQGAPARTLDLSDDDRMAVLDCQLLSLKPVLYVANVQGGQEMENETVLKLRTMARREGAEAVAICGRDEAEINELPEEERGAFLQELGVEEPSAERILHAAYRELQLVDFFTAGEKEVRVWTCPKGSTAAVAAGKIHSDMERGFIRMEVIAFEDLMDYGSEAAVIRAGKRRLEGKE
ncbi:MAG TPA: redox-regulated ATPase YchF, partial [Candidatus Acetothermia bacterium]|nr:redox-regulated ATPase YchF [Candidatus Acetothermia bacterium]